MIARVDGVLTSGHWWQGWTVSDPTAVIILVHGLHEHSGRYNHVADAFAQAAFSTYAVDHFGHGNSTGVQGNIRSMTLTVDGVADLVRDVAKRHPDVPAFVYGHSMGGLIALQYLTGTPHSGVVGAIISAPALDSGSTTWVRRLIAPVASCLAPNLELPPLDVATLSRDPAVLDAYRTDPLTRSGGMRVRTGREMMTTIEAMPQLLPELVLPLLLIHGEDDRLVLPTTSTMVNELAGSDDITLTIYPGLRHEVHNEPERVGVLADVVAWLRTHLDDIARSSR